jgi:hypothetical protein
MCCFYYFQLREKEASWLPIDITFIKEIWVPNVFIYRSVLGITLCYKSIVAFTLSNKLNNNKKNIFRLVSFSPLDCIKVDSILYADFFFLKRKIAVRLTFYD